MKRTAAIIGPTPAFIRWAIHLPCGLREIETANLPASTFRQLRAIKELDLAKREQRIFQGVAFHADTHVGKDLVGFLPDEILAASGGQAAVDDACLNCRANTNSEGNGWCGCFGIAQLPPNAIVEFDAIAEQLRRQDKQPGLLETTRPAWFGVWLSPIIANANLGLLASIFSELDWGDEWHEFRLALVACANEQLEMHVEYFPAGNSDGLHWRLNAHCENCKQELSEAAKKCQCCGRVTVSRTMKKRKVLGLRPYMQLKYVLGEQRSEQLIKDYLRWKTKTDS